MNEHETDQTHFREHQADSAQRGGDPNGQQIRLGANQEPPQQQPPPETDTPRTFFFVLFQMN
jgi:hypothetical protein